MKKRDLKKSKEMKLKPPPVGRTKKIALLLVLYISFHGSAAYGTNWDILPKGTQYCADTYDTHLNYLNSSKENTQYVVDLNFENDLGTKLYAPEDGFVGIETRVADGDTWGNSISWTNKDQNETLHLAHLQSIEKTGEVMAGDIIGTLGGTGGWSPHLHISRKVNGQISPVEISGKLISPGYPPDDQYGGKPPCYSGITYTSIGSKPATQQGDLSISNINITNSTVALGEKLEVSYDVKYSGDGISPKTLTRFVYSHDEVLSSDDIAYIDLIDELEPNQTYRWSTLVSTSVLSQPGEYYLIVVLDHLNNVIETNESNNISEPAAVSLTNGGTGGMLPPDLEIKNFDTDRISTSIGGQLVVEWEVHNTGYTTARNSYSGIYLSSNSTITANDLFLISEKTNSLDPEEVDNELETVTLPSDIESGEWWIGIIADHKDDVLEDVETNNESKSIKIVVTENEELSEGPDFEALSIDLYGYEFDAGEEFEFDVFVKNVGNQRTISPNIAVYISEDTNFEHEELLFTVDSEGNLDPNEDDIWSYHGYTDSDWYSGKYYLSFVVDYDNLETEENEINNITYTEIYINGLPPPPDLPDLRISGGIVSRGTNTTRAGDNFWLNSNIHNKGTRQIPSPTSTVAAFISTDKVYDPNDLVIGTADVPELSYNEKASQSIYVSIPSSLSAGFYYFGYVVDPSNNVIETDETNNVRWFTEPVEILPGLPDLRISGGIVGRGTNTTRVGDYFWLNSNIHNWGTREIPSPTSTVAAFISTDKVYDTNDLVIGTADVAELAYNEKASQSIYVSIPSSLSAGSYYFGYVVDPSNNVIETDETNNVRWFTEPVEMLPGLSDLRISGGIVGRGTNTTRAGDNFWLNSNIHNWGTREIPSSNSTVAAFISTDKVYDPNDLVIGTADVAELAYNEKASQSIYVSIPSSLSAGFYYFGYVVDPSNNVIETDETNNVRWFTEPVEILPGLPDLRISGGIVGRGTNTTRVGDYFWLNSNIHNWGTREIPSPTSTVAAFISTDKVYDTNDLVIGTADVAELAYNEKASQSIYVSIPSSLSAGSYYFGYVVDPSNNVIETDETNNVRWFNGAVYVDGIVNKQINVDGIENKQTTDFRNILPALMLLLDLVQSE